jgi:hypothetical protein
MEDPSNYSIDERLVARSHDESGDDSISAAMFVMG